MARVPLRAIRIPDDLWDAARAKADQEGRSVSEVVREMLARWVTRPPRKPRR
ncbi:ribbon-helix-helix protein, CopG family [Mycolicibacterium sp.]|uniref:ribbon-helix-helix protein, CopG family n=1 Tax=Mycolicibacterium sp. TaxID=2320850 RepID=UPI003569FD9C